jgi:hypothetical protein
MIDDGCRNGECGGDKTSQSLDLLKPTFDSSLGGNTEQSKTKPEGSTTSITLKPTPPINSHTDNQDVDVAQAIAGAGLILATDLFIGLPCAYVIVATGGVTPPAIAAEALEVFVVLPANLFGLYLIYDAFQN